MSVGQVAALAVLLPAAVVAMIYTMSEIRDAWQVLFETRRGTIDAYKVAAGFLGVAVADSVLAVTFWLVLS